jgi:hypothetical protein
VIGIKMQSSGTKYGISIFLSGKGTTTDYLLRNLHGYYGVQLVSCIVEKRNEVDLHSAVSMLKQHEHKLKQIHYVPKFTEDIDNLQTAEIELITGLK